MMIKVMVFIVILACAGPFFIKGPDGKPLLTIDEFVADLSPANLIPNAVK
mgnify:FL=1